MKTSYEAEVLTAIEVDLSLPPGFLLPLLDGDDWGFVIKLCAILEAALSQALAISAGDDRLADFFGELNFSESKTGKIGLALKLNLLEKNALPFLRCLKKIRNLAAHNVHHLDLDIIKYLTLTQSSELNVLVQALNTLFQDIPHTPLICFDPELVSKYPRMYLLSGFVIIFASLGLNRSKESFNGENIKRRILLRSIEILKARYT